MSASRVLVVEDEALFARAVVRRLERDGHEVAHAGTLAEARAALGAAGVAPAHAWPHAVLLDMRLPDGSGMELFDLLGRLPHPPAVLVMTAFGGLDDAVAAMRAGARDYITKPLDLDALSARLKALLAEATEIHGVSPTGDKRGASDLPAPQFEEAGDDVEAGVGTLENGLLGDSDAMRLLRAEVQRVSALATSGAPPPTVLVLGETGTGKDVVARALHAGSARAGRRFVHVDCAALPKGVIEAELFGHARGAFTGAHAARIGLIEAAGDGTVFLDEVGELPLDVQSRLLAVLERRRLRRVGATDETTVGAWFVAATNRDLPAMVRDGTFRADLYYRLDVMPLRLPPLRDRDDDVALLAQYYLALRGDKALTPDALTALRSHRWPGNVRELVNVMERAAMSADATVGVVALGLTVATSTEHEVPPLPEVRELDGAPVPASAQDETLAGTERALIEQALGATGGNVSAAARQLGVSRMTLRYRLEKYGIAPPARRT